MLILFKHLDRVFCLVLKACLHTNEDRIEFEHITLIKMSPEFNFVSMTNQANVTMKGPQEHNNIVTSKILAS